MKTFYLRLKGTPNRRERNLSWGRENDRRKMISDLRNMCTHPQHLRGHTIQRGYIQKIGMKFSRKKTNGKHQTSGGGSYRWCFIAEI